jgi:hypothetical protein
MIINARFSKIAGLFFLLVVLLVSACATEPKREAVKTEPAIKAEPLLPLDAIDERISFLQNLLLDNKIQEGDKNFFSNLISEYQRMKDLSQGDQPQHDDREIILMLFNNLSLLNEKYFSYQEQVNNEIYAKALSDLNLKKQNILKKYFSKDYKGVISESGELEKTFGKDFLSYDIGILLAISLSREKRFSEAINICERFIKDMEGRPDLIQLRASFIECWIATGKKERALKEFQKLAENMNERKTVFDKTASKVNRLNNNMDKSDLTLNKLLSKDLNLDMAARISGISKEVDNLTSQGDFSGARLLLLKWKLHADDPVEITEIDKAIKALDTSEGQYQENLKNNTRGGLEAAVKLIEKEEYESAINMLDLVKSGGDSNPEIDKQKNIAVEKLINKERNRAAKIFLTAKKTDDLKKKEALLLSAQNILNDLIAKYPLSGSVGKLKNNVDAVNAELRKNTK